MKTRDLVAAVGIEPNLRMRPLAHKLHRGKCKRHQHAGTLHRVQPTTTTRTAQTRHQEPRPAMPHVRFRLQERLDFGERKIPLPMTKPTMSAMDDPILSWRGSVPRFSLRSVARMP